MNGMEEDRKNICNAWKVPLQPGNTIAEVSANCRKYFIDQFNELEIEIIEQKKGKKK